MVLTWKNQRIVNAALCAISIFLAVYSTNLILFFLSPAFQPNDSLTAQRIRFADRFGIPFDTREKHQGLIGLRKNGINAYPNV